MADGNSYPKRLIEVDLPIKRISAHARREKSIRHGHISTLHIWWARRPLAACRAVVCAALWPDPADLLCPVAFREVAAKLMINFARKVTSNAKLAQNCSSESAGRWFTLSRPETKIDLNNTDHLNILRYSLLDFIADFANWSNSTVKEYLDTSRALTWAAHEALGGVPGTRPLVVDPFAGGGAIPLEALRVGADAFASDLNPVAVLLNKVVLEYIPKYGQRLADEVRKWGKWVKEQAEKELAEFYPKDPDGATPIAYLWARTITCEGPGCGAEVPLIRSLWLAKRRDYSVALRMVHNPEEKQVDFEIIQNAKARDVANGTIRRGSAVCPLCGYTTPVESVRTQLRNRQGGANDARLFAVVTTYTDQQGRFYRLPTDQDMRAIRKAQVELERQKAEHTGVPSLAPNESLPPRGTLGFRVQLYGMEQWSDLFTLRQTLALVTLIRLVNALGKLLDAEYENQLYEAVKVCLALAVDKQADSNSSLCSWRPASQDIGHTFGRQALPMIWDFVEGNVLSGATRDWLNAVQGGLKAIESLDEEMEGGHAEYASAFMHPFPDAAAQCFFTDPPYYDAVPYADLSDFFFVWLKRTLGSQRFHLFTDDLSPKEDECIVDEIKGKDKNYFVSAMKTAMAEGHRILAPNGIGIVVFAHKSTSGWEAQLSAMLEAGWTITGSWPIDTEMGSRLRAHNSAALASSVHLVCRPRSNGGVGDWRDVLQELPKRIGEWMPRLASEGVVGADAIFSCLGPALEIFSRYSRVEKASGEQVTLKEYLEHVWAAVAREALKMIFQGADATGFEEDARLTAMWLWTLSTGNGSDEDQQETKASTGYTLEFDAARKIAQGLGAHLENLESLVEIKGDKARLLPVSERISHLLGKDQRSESRKKKSQQLTFFDTIATEEEADIVWREENMPELGDTTLDRVHQSMILFAAGRAEALKRFLVEEGVGSDQRFWRLAQAFSALYPSNTDEKRWIDGVLARKKGLGL